MESTTSNFTPHKQRAKPVGVSRSSRASDTVFVCYFRQRFTPSSFFLFLHTGQAVEKSPISGIEFDRQAHSFLKQICDFVEAHAGVQFLQDEHRIREKFPVSDDGPTVDLKVYEVRLYFRDCQFFREYWNKGVICAKQVHIGIDEAIAVFTADLADLFRIWSSRMSNFEAFVMSETAIGTFELLLL